MPLCHAMRRRRAQGGQVGVGIGDRLGVGQVEEVGGIDGGLCGHHRSLPQIVEFCQALRGGQT